MSNTTKKHQQPPKEGKQLSAAAAAAQYHKNQRYGVFDSPGAPVVGVPTSSSGSAAILAAKSDLSLKLWHQDKPSNNANTAAVLANTNKKSPEIWKPDVSSTAATAALLVKDYKQPEAPKPDAQLGRNASLAALSAHKTPAADFAADKLPDAYAWKGGQGASSLGRSASMHVYKKNRESTRSRAKSVHDDNPPPNPLGNIVNLESKAREAATKRLSGLYGPPPSAYATQDRDKWVAQNAAASSSLAAREDLGVQSQQEKQKQHDKALKESIVQHESLMKAARARADASMSQIDKGVGERNLFSNQKYNKAALAAAEKNSKSRMVNHGKVDIGGGMFLTQTQIDQIAQRNVQPVLDEIAVKAENQRQADEERRQAEEEERAKKAEEKRLEQEKKAEDKRIKKEESQKKKAIKDHEKEVAKDERAKQKEVDNERKRVMKAEQRKLKDERKQERLRLKNAAEERKNAEQLAKDELAKVTALQEAAAAKVEAARLAEEQAANEAAAEQARLEKEQHEAELAEANQQLESAKQDHAEKEKATMVAESIIDDHDKESAMIVGADDDDDSEESSDLEPAGEAGLTTGAIAGPTASKLDINHDANDSTIGLEGPNASELALNVAQPGGVDSSEVSSAVTARSDAESLETPTITRNKGKQKDLSGLEARSSTDDDDWEIVSKDAASEVGVVEVKQSPNSSTKVLAGSPSPGHFTENTDEQTPEPAESKAPVRATTATTASSATDVPKRTPSTRLSGLFKQIGRKANPGRIRGLSSTSKEDNTPPPIHVSSRQKPKQPLPTGSDKSGAGLASVAARAAASTPPPSSQPKPQQQQEDVYEAPSEAGKDVKLTNAMQRKFSGFSDSEDSSKNGKFTEQL